KEELCVTLWGDVAETFSFLSVHTLSLPIIIVFISFKTRSFLIVLVPHFFSLTRTSQRFSACKGPIQVLPPSSRQMNEAEVLHTARRVTIDELVFLDPDLYKSKHLHCYIFNKNLVCSYFFDEHV
ncbi:hypothetical protein DVH24_034374, partial [Malus domestica]